MLIRLVPVLVASALIVACGGGNGSSTAIAPVAIPTSTTASSASAASQDAQARANARTTETALETCYANTQTFAGCNTATALGPDVPALGSGPGQVQLKLSAQGYTITAHSQSGDAFMLSRSASGSVQRTCAGPDHAGGCHAGSW